MTQPSQSAAAPAPAESTSDEDLFLQQIRKGGRNQSKYL
jgi:hypothetical protein